MDWAWHNRKTLMTLFKEQDVKPSQVIELTRRQASSRRGKRAGEGVVFYQTVVIFSELEFQES